MKILFATDHAGFELKQILVSFVQSLGHEVEDMGATAFDAQDDFPVYIAPLAMKIAEKPDKYLGIILGGSGEGEAMVANRFPEVRATVYYGGNLEIVRLGKEHNDANVLSLGARFLNETQAKEAVQIWLQTPFSGDERHERRIQMIDSIV